ncbi:MAG: hypothetical protein MK085_07605 [Phycisphaerales bacterium]|nr:hypothetical protein [Phycisphaerales bacterium]
MTSTADWTRIAQVLPDIDLLEEMARGFVEYAQGRCVIPPVGELLLEEDPPGEVHIKYGCVRGGAFYVVKIASGFPRNVDRGLPNSNGIMLLFDRETGELARMLLDEGRLTDLRTAAAGALAARLLAPPEVRRIGILGTGVQARLQLRQMAGVIDCTDALVCGRRAEALEACRSDMADTPFTIEGTTDPAELAARCELIVTTTSAHEPLLQREWIRPGTHLVAVGSDTPEKQELDVGILAAADRVVCDSLAQSRLRGEVSQALRAGVIKEADVVEIGAILDGQEAGRDGAEDVTVVDLTGVAVQDLRIAEAVHQRLG